jgi:hypothetical protein
MQIEALPPERRTKKSLILLGDGCCCCCCCCLHSVGGLAGAVVASRKKRVVATSEDMPGAGSAPGIYWLTVGGLCAACVGPAAGFGRGVEGIEVGLVGILMGFPLIQLAAALLAVIVLACLPKSIVAEKRPEMRTIGRIALYTFGGAMAGLIIMVGGFYAFSGVFR